MSWWKDKFRLKFKEGWMLFQFWILEKERKEGSDQIKYSASLNLYILQLKPEDVLEKKLLFCGSGECTGHVYSTKYNLNSTQ